jgi:hypothetical protein
MTVLKFGRQISVNNPSIKFHRNMSHDNQVFAGRKTDGRPYGMAEVTSPIVVFRKVL